MEPSNRARDEGGRPRTSLPVLIGSAPAVVALRRTISRAAVSDAKVLITGESGVGKELVAKSIHAGSRRAGAPFVTINCATGPEALLESELFGHVRGSFTDAHRDAAGTVEHADGGTLLLDEAGEMSLRMQALLLRFLESGEIQKVGATCAADRVDVRVLAATSRDLEQLASSGAFREDLFYRLNVIHIHVPPLRERREDIPALINDLLQQCDSRNGPTATLPPETVAALQSFQWPGNVRQLQNVVQRLVIQQPGEPLSPRLLEDLQCQHTRAVSTVVDRRRPVADELYDQLTRQHQSFWSAVYPRFMGREITRHDLREVIRRGLRESCGTYRGVTQLFNIHPSEYKKFLDFLRKHGCQLPFRDFR